MGDPKTTDSELIEALDLHFEKFFQKYHAPVMGLINSYDSVTQLAEVRTVVKLNIENIEQPVAPIIRGVTVAWPSGRDHSHTWPLFPGDGMTLIPQDADVGRYLASGTVYQNPRSTRKMSMSDALGFPLVARPQGAVLPPEAMAADGAVLRGLTYVGSGLATEFAAMANKTDSGLQKVLARVESHAHPSNGSPPTPQVPPVALSPTACTKLKVT